jgi:hypothetical protein
MVRHVKGETQQLNPPNAAKMTGADAVVLHWADEVAKVDLFPIDRIFLESSRDRFVQAHATLSNPNASMEDRGQALNNVINEALNIGEIKGRIATALWGRKAFPRLQTSEASKKKTKNAEIRRNRLLESLDKDGRSPNIKHLVDEALEKEEAFVRGEMTTKEKKRRRDALRQQFKRDTTS